MSGTDIKVWRIAGIVSGICSLGLLGLVLYQAAWLGNPRTLALLREEPLEMVAILLITNTMLAGLISFPFYWSRGMLLLSGWGSPIVGQEWRRYCLGLGASCLCIVLTLLLKQVLD